MTTITKEGMTIHLPIQNTIYDWKALVNTMIRMHVLASASKEFCLEVDDHYGYLLFMDELLDLTLEKE